MKKLIYTIKNLSMMIGLVVIILAFIFNIYFPFKTNHGENISVPNLIGMELNEINSFLYDRDLRYEILEDSSYFVFWFGRSGGTRTHNLRFWRPALYQLNYAPKSLFYYLSYYSSSNSFSTFSNRKI